MSEQKVPEDPPFNEVTTDAEASVPPSRSLLVRRTAWALLGVLVIVPVVLVLTGSVELLAQSILFRLTNSQPPIEAEAIRASPPPARSDFTFEESPFHPDRLYAPYFGVPVDELPASPRVQRLIAPFRELLDLYITRQGQDDNFTIRVLDKRDGRTLEVYELEEARERFDETGEGRWSLVDKQRRIETRRLVDKWVARGIPKEAVGARWGRANQVREAREREAPFINYEVRLARYLGLSLLATEIGTVETFNDDKLVSSVGARSRYQMMPAVLRQNGIYRYSLRTAYGKKVQVIEDWHPLLTMEPAFLFLRGYVNAAGHEIPGISSYHTGPGNMFKLYRMFLSEQPDLLTADASVMDAYAWAVTDGYDLVSRNSSFRTYSRGYVPSGYGALRAVEGLPVDTTQTMLAERVQLEAGQEVYLSTLLGVLAEDGELLRWGPGTDDLTVYERFRRLNQHIDLPAGDLEGGVPRDGDVLLKDEVQDVPVRFFLPLNATQALARKNINILDEKATFRFDSNTYRIPKGAETEADREYAALLGRIEHFGFTYENRTTLRRLVAEFERLARENPSHYRRAQLAIIKNHAEVWSYSVFDKLAESVRAVRGSLRLPVRPPDQLEPIAVRPPIGQ